LALPKAHPKKRIRNQKTHYPLNTHWSANTLTDNPKSRGTQIVTTVRPKCIICVVYRLLPIAYCLLAKKSATHSIVDGGVLLLPIAYCLLPNCLLPIAYCLLPIAYCLLPIAYCPFPIDCIRPIAYCLLPIAFCLLGYPLPDHQEFEYLTK
jgi:hypothetical protein